MLKTALAQKLTLADLISISNKKNWQDVNQFLMAKGWDYYESERGDTYKYNIITWSYKKEFDSDKASAWFYLYTYEGFPNKIRYSVFNKESYSFIQNSITPLGFKLVNSEIEDDELTSTFSGLNHNLEIITEKRTKEGYYLDNVSFTAYTIVLINKAGIYDPDNGRKYEYYDDGTIKGEYTLINGEMHGQVKMYHENGELQVVGNYNKGVKHGNFKIYSYEGVIQSDMNILNGELNGIFKNYYDNGKVKKSGSYLKGKAHGKFTEYDEEGIITKEYAMANDLKNGQYKEFQENKLVKVVNYKDDIKNGPVITYFYDEETGKLRLKEIGEYLEDEQHGTWKVFYCDGVNGDRVMTVDNYKHGFYYGFSQQIYGDSVVVLNFVNDTLHGRYKLYKDVGMDLLKGVFNTDTNKMRPLEEGYYEMGLKNGLWKYYSYDKLLKSGAYKLGKRSGFWQIYDNVGDLRVSGSYMNGTKNGEWKYYFPNWRDMNDSFYDFSGALYLVENYHEGILNGQFIRYYDVRNPGCTQMDDDDNFYNMRACDWNDVYKKNESVFYNMGMMNGLYELYDSNGIIEQKGSYVNGLKDGEWLHRIVGSSSDVEAGGYTYQKGKYVRDEKAGIWNEYNASGQLVKTTNYASGKLNGEMIIWGKPNLVIEKRNYSKGQLVYFVLYDNINGVIQKKYEVISYDPSLLQCRYTQYFSDVVISEVFSIATTYYKKDQDMRNYILEKMNSQRNGSNVYRNGEYLLMKPNGQHLVSGRYLRDDEDGYWYFYYYGQNVKIEILYGRGRPMAEKYFDLNGNLYNGKFIYNRSEENTSEIRSIKNGLRDGKTITVDEETKKIIKREKYKEGKLIK
jgi:antitoxin component YwqK of YwqJK toxin-antitoxin module